MEAIKWKANQLIHEFKGENYVFGINVFDQLAKEVAKIGKKVSVIVNVAGRNWIKPYIKKAEISFQKYGIKLAGEFINGARPNAPQEDLIHISDKIKEQQPEVVISIGGGSTIDAVKAAIAFNCLGDKYPNIDDYFGNDKISQMLSHENRQLLPHFAVMIAASSAAHLTKYSNITDIHINQKMLIVDEAIVPSRALFDYSLTTTQPHSLTIDGALDGISHSLEVLMGIPESNFEKAVPVCLTGISLIVNNIKNVVNNPNDLNAREAIGLGTDLGGFAIMIGGTSGAHLNSFSLTDILSHGRACALMNPYYIVFFSNVIGNRLKEVAKIYQMAGYIQEDIESLSGRDVGIVLANGMIELSKAIGFPTTLMAVPGYTDAHKIKCLRAAKNPKLDSKLKNMPIPMSIANIDEYMGSVLNAAENGNMKLIKKL